MEAVFASHGVGAKGHWARGQRRKPARGFQWDFIIWLAVQCVPRTSGLCLFNCAGPSSKAKYWWGYPCTDLQSYSVLNIDHQALRVGTPQKYLPSNGEESFGWGSEWPSLPNLLRALLQTGICWVVIIFPYQITHIAFIQKVCVSDKVPNWLSLMFMTHITDKHLLSRFIKTWVTLFVNSCEAHRPLLGGTDS